MTLFAACLPLFSLSQECDPPAAITNFGANQIHAQLGQGGNFWNATQEDWGMYLPGQEGGNMLYTAGLIVGGISPDNQLKLAGAGYSGSGTDFYAGPLSTNGTAETSTETCLMWDRFFTIYEQHVQRHKTYFDCLDDPECDVEELFPFGYVIPESFLEYPAHGDVSLNQDFNLAPFYDRNLDGTYNPTDGDAPYFNSVYGEGDCCESLKGHVCTYWITNDKGNAHTYSGGDPIGLEVQHMTYAYAASNYLGRTIFQNEKLINRGTQTLTDTYLGHFIDADLGSPYDDMFGADSARQAVYFYNGDDYDEPTFEASAFESRIPAMAWVQLRGPLADADGEDQDDDGIVDNETIQLTNVLGTDVGNFPNFTIPLNFYNYMQSFLSNGAHYNENSINKDFQWEAPIEAPEVVGEVPPFDVKCITSTGGFTLEPGDFHCLSHAFTYSRPDEDALAIVALADLSPQVDSLHMDFAGCFTCVPPSVDIQVEEIEPGVYTFFNLAGADEHVWNFGDGSMSDFAYPTHTYGADGLYTVTLELSNACGTALGEVEIDALATDVSESTGLYQLEVYPNPASNILIISGLGNDRPLIRIYDVRGQLVWDATVSDDRVEIPVDQWNAGLYLVAIDLTEHSEGAASSYQIRIVVD